MRNLMPCEYTVHWHFDILGRQFNCPRGVCSRNGASVISDNKPSRPGIPSACYTVIADDQRTQRQQGLPESGEPACLSSQGKCGMMLSEKVAKLSCRRRHQRLMVFG
jgi:hypothetical protein